MADYSYGYKCVNNMAAGPKTLRKSPDPTQRSGWGLGTRLNSLKPRGGVKAGRGPGRGRKGVKAGRGRGPK